ncbi:MAG: YihY/virulence factor BrkB family protein [Saprospiraceae bacterium]|nr:YihY/virulence factor BrkB family protein [Saprospiraceae bacterium]
MKATFGKFSDSDVLTQSAALSYYTIFSLPPMLLVILTTTTQFYSESEIKNAIFGEIGGLVGHDGAQQLSSTIDKMNIYQPTWWATILGIGVLVFTATTVFITMQNALNLIFEVKPAEHTKGFGLLKMLRDRAISFALLVSVAFILLVSLVVDALITSFGKYLSNLVGDVSAITVLVTSTLLPLAIITLLFAMLFKFLPDAKLAWRDTWFGALVTAVFFSLGKFLIGFYIGSSSAANLYDAAGSILVVMLWVYYASAIFLFGATFTFVRAKQLNGRVKPEDYAERVIQTEIKLEKGADVALISTIN